MLWFRQWSRWYFWYRTESATSADIPVVGIHSLSVENGVKWWMQSTNVDITFLMDLMPFRQTLKVLSFSNLRIWARTSSDRRRGLFHSRIVNCWTFGQLAIKSAAISKETGIFYKQNLLTNYRNHLLCLNGELNSLSLTTRSNISSWGTWQRRCNLLYVTGSFR